MKKNRGNYYRILHVQAEAPLEAIKASYRTLMGPLRHHPDRGGEHEAALLNEVYAVLSDPGPASGIRPHAGERALARARSRARRLGCGSREHARSVARAGARQYLLFER